MGDAWGATNTTPALDQRWIDTLRFLSVDMVQKANSGHPGRPAPSCWVRGLARAARSTRSAAASPGR